MSAGRFDLLAAELEVAFGQPSPAGWPEGRFEDLALRCFSLQFEQNAPYRALCEARGVRPGSIAGWEEAPPVPATAFKFLDLVTGPAEAVEGVFVTSGTTQGASRRGRHLVRRMGLYRASAVPNFRAHLLPEGDRMPLVSLVPPPATAPGSSLSAMVGMVAEELCDRADWAWDGAGAIDLGVLRRVAEDGRPVLLVGTALAFVHLLEAMSDAEPLRLAPGTRIMETGGFKGWAGAVSREGLYRDLSSRLGVPAARIVNEYGMTELLSQLYEPVLTRSEGVPRRHMPPPWLRVRALDPTTLEPLPEGDEGVLSFFDLANLGSVCHVLTEDVGAVGPEGVLLRGRAPGAEARGCSRAVDEMLSVSGGHP